MRWAFCIAIEHRRRIRVCFLTCLPRPLSASVDDSNKRPTRRLPSFCAPGHCYRSHSSGSCRASRKHRCLSHGLAVLLMSVSHISQKNVQHLNALEQNPPQGGAVSFARPSPLDCLQALLGRGLWTSQPPPICRDFCMQPFQGSVAECKIWKPII
jgi:hypothetical protein